MYFKYDLKIGFRKNIMSLFIIAAIVFTAALASHIQILDEKSVELILPRNLNSMDYFLHVFEGMRPYSRVSDERFQLPITWFLMNVILFYFTGKYPYSEIYNNHGANVLVRGGSREKWFISKWMWCIVCVTLYYFVAYVVLLLFCLMVNVPISFDIQPIAYQNLLSPVMEITQVDVIKVMILPLISSMAAVSVQLVISLVTSDFTGFMFMAVLYISSAYYFTPLLIGNFSMLARSAFFYIGGIPIMQAIISSIVISILSLIAGIYFFRRQDIMERR